MNIDVTTILQFLGVAAVALVAGRLSGAFTIVKRDHTAVLAAKPKQRRRRKPVLQSKAKLATPRKRGRPKLSKDADSHVGEAAATADLDIPTSLDRRGEAGVAP